MKLGSVVVGAKHYNVDTDSDSETKEYTKCGVRKKKKILSSVSIENFQNWLQMFWDMLGIGPMERMET